MRLRYVFSTACGLLLAGPMALAIQAAGDPAGSRPEASARINGQDTLFASAPRDWMGEEKDRWKPTTPPPVPVIAQAAPLRPSRKPRVPAARPERPILAATMEPPKPVRVELPTGPRLAVETAPKPNPLLTIPMFVRARPEPPNVSVYALDANGNSVLPIAPLFRTRPAPIIPAHAPKSATDGGSSTARADVDTADAPASLPVFPVKPPLK